MRSVGRLTANAEVRTVKGGKTVVDFTVVENYRYKSKGQKKEIATFFDCSLWNKEKLAVYLTKGALVEVEGIAKSNIYTNKMGKTVGRLAIIVNDITLFGGGKKAEQPQSTAGTPVIADTVIESAIKPSTQFDTIPVPDNPPF